MSQFFYDFATLEKGTQIMVDCLKQCYTDMGNRKVHPGVQPGFLRQQLPQNPPEEGKDIAHVIKQTKDKIYPGLMLWQSPKYFGFFPSSVAVTDVFAEMFATTFHSPAFNFFVSPSHTEVENILMDWTAKAFGLPQQFLLKNSGGGQINNSATESVFISIHAAKHLKMEQLEIPLNDPRTLKFVAYYSEFAHNCAEKGLVMKQIFHRRPVRVNYIKEKRNYELDIDMLRSMIEKDIDDGLIPFWFGSTYGNTLCGAVDLTAQLIQIVKKHKLWLNVDASYLGSTWICPEFRPNIELLKQADSLEINFSKVLLIGPGGSTMFVKDKKKFIKSFKGTGKFCFYNNPYSEKPQTIDYKDWHFGLDRRNNGLKFFFLFQHYGLKNIRKLIRETEQKAKKLEEIVLKDSDIFEVFSRVFGIICFQVKDKRGLVNEEITRRVNDRITNIQEGFLSPGYFKGEHLIRFVVGNYQSDMQIITRYYEKIKQAAIEQREIEQKKRI